VIPLSSADADTTEAEETPQTDERREALLAELADHLGDALLDSHIEPGHDLWIRVPATAWKSTMRHLRNDHGFRFFEFLSAIDWMPSPYGRYEDAAVDVAAAGEAPTEPAAMETGVAGGETRFQVFARLVDVSRRDLGIIIKADVPPAGDDPDQPGTVESIISVFPGANWHEREVHEMFGIGFEGHPYLMNLYLPTGFEGHPLRKDYPLLARVVKPWPGIVDVEPMPDEGEADEEEGEG
jgi:NADH-quinone oxidoreductase subunit C